jgi:hypothetical protein
MACFTLRLLQKDAKEADANWVPLSDVMVYSTPNCATLVDRKPSTQMAAEIPLRGTVSTQRVVRSTIVKR